MSGHTFEMRLVMAALETGPQEVAGLVCGPLYVAETDAREWRLCHLVSGHSIARFDYWFDACKAAVRLAGERWSDDVAELVADEALAAKVRAVVAQVEQEAFENLELVDGAKPS